MCFLCMYCMYVWVDIYVFLSRRYTVGLNPLMLNRQDVYVRACMSVYMHKIDL